MSGKREARERREEQRRIFHEVVGIAGMNLRGQATDILKGTLQKYIDRYEELSKPKPREQRED